MDPIHFCESVDPEWQAEIIAAYTISNQIEAVMAQEGARKQNDRASQSQDQGQGKGKADRPARPWRTDSIKESGTWE
jgi:hypothetical protein